MNRAGRLLDGSSAPVMRAAILETGAAQEGTLLSWFRILVCAATFGALMMAVIFLLWRPMASPFNVGRLEEQQGTR